MPVSTRSQLFLGQDEPTPNLHSRAKPDQEESQMAPSLVRNPHHRLKEKMKALTQLYEQQKQQTAALRNPAAQSEEQRFSTHPSIDLLGSHKKDDKESKTDGVMRENLQLPNGVKPVILPTVDAAAEDVKENVMAFDRFPGFSCPKKPVVSTVARKLSMGNLVPQSEGKIFKGMRTGGEMDAISENSEMCSRILVFVRLRPMSKKEREAGSRCCVRIVNRRDIYLTEFANENDYLRLKRVRGRHFTFDASFPEATTQQEVYATTTADLVESVLQGRNGTVFCYGATGAGKTYTMLGTVENPGVMVLAIKDLFSKIRQRSCDGNHVVHLSYLEVYNETVRDLLSPGRPLVLREDKQGIVAAGLTQYRAYSTDEVMALLQQGNLNRTTEPTRVNETSSRSHAILQVIAEYRVKDGANIVSKVGKLSLIDLAGSERALATEQRTLRSLEGANINRSLLALSSCINALVEGKKHIPYRNSKLTQLLKDSLGGSCNTVMIANISPCNLSLGETQNTLHWADRAKEIRTKACMPNEEPVAAYESETDQAKLLLELQKENHELRMQLAHLQQKLLATQAQSLVTNSSPTLTSVTSILSPSTQPTEKRRQKSSLLSRNCFTPDPKRKGAEDTIKELRQIVKSLEVDMERLKIDHALQIKQKDAFIRELSRNNPKPLQQGTARVVTRASLKPKDPGLKDPVGRTRVKGEKMAIEGELKSPSSRFLSPAPTAKKRSFWDITTANSPSVMNPSGRKTRTLVAVDQAPSMLLQPGFARQRYDPPNQ